MTIRGDGGAAHVAGVSQSKGTVRCAPSPGRHGVVPGPVPGRKGPYRAPPPVYRPDTRPAGWMPGLNHRAELIAWKARELEKVGSGNRNKALWCAAAYLGDQRVPLEEVRPALMAVPEAIGLEQKESKSTVESGRRSEGCFRRSLLTPSFVSGAPSWRWEPPPSWQSQYWAQIAGQRQGPDCCSRSPHRVDG